MTLDKLRTLLQQPPAEHRSLPFWAWNDKLKPDELKRQIREMKDQGIGGFFIHSREGLETEYLSSEWMDCVETALREAEKLGMEAWLYDEDKWPSGSAGGLVGGSENGEFTAAAITAEFIFDRDQSSGSDSKSADSDNSIIIIYELDIEEDNHRTINGFKRIETLQDCVSPDSPLLICRMEISGRSEWYNGKAPSDNLNPLAVRRFLDLTHEQYRQVFGDEFGKTIRGFFTDEPNYCDFFSHFTPGRPWLPWSGILPDFFKKRRGYEIENILPLLFIEGPGQQKGRYDFWLTLTELFVSSYTQQIYEWCDQQELELTGHMLYENDLGYSVRVSGASMPHYRFMHSPGIDILGDQRQEYLTVKQCTSVANQFRRSSVITETYGCTGWDFSFAGMKRLGDWQYVMGVNRRCQHLALYSFTGCRKRDYPPSFNYHNGWWSHNNILEDYFARLSLCVSEGEIIRDILFLHPLSTFWMNTASAADEDLSHIQMNMGWLDDHILDKNKEGDKLNRLTRQLLEAQLDFDFGDELIIRDEGQIENGQFKIGHHKYKVVIIPQVETLMSSTLDLLEEFLLAGGRVYWIKSFPRMVDALPSNRAVTLSRHPEVIPIENSRELINILSELEKRFLRIEDEFGREARGFLSMIRKVDQGWICTIVNTDYCRKDVILHLEQQGEVAGFDLMTGKEWRETVLCLPGTKERGMSLSVSFAPEETRVFFIISKSVSRKADFQFPYQHPHQTQDLVQGFPSTAKVTLSMMNALVLDRCEYIYKGKRIKEGPVWEGQKLLRQTFHMPPVYYNGAPQRYTWIKDEIIQKSIPVTQHFSFFVDEIPEGPVYAAVEKSSGFQIRCNGEKSTLTDQHYLDRDLLMHHLPSLRKGKNLLEISLEYKAETELENIFIIGDFAVNRERRICRFSGKLDRGDWTYQGLLHYPGSVIYHYNLPPVNTSEERKTCLKLGDFAGTAAKIIINKGKEVYALRGDTTIDISGSLHRNKGNKVEVEIIGSLRNLMGPFHRKFTSCSRISWEDFRCTGENYTEDYNITAQGLIGELAVIKC